MCDGDCIICPCWGMCEDADTRWLNHFAGVGKKVERKIYDDRTERHCKHDEL